MVIRDGITTVAQTKILIIFLERLAEYAWNLRNFLPKYCSSEADPIRQTFPQEVFLRTTSYIGNGSSGTFPASVLQY